MVDCASFDANMASAEELQEKFKGQADEGDERNVAPLLMAQIEFADVIGLSKCDLVPAEEVDMGGGMDMFGDGGGGDDY